ncbi:MAG: hypothetical protein GY696_24535, partial [Gammaproteobacteria bacterium]|nr:hypothetical protein [Gammaproteobacteria bacterium]
MWGRQKRQVTANNFASSKMWTRVEAGPVTCPHQHHRGDAPPPTRPARAHMWPRPPFQAEIQAGAAREQEGELPENPEPEEPLRTEGPLQEELMPEEPLPEEEEEKTQPTQPQISPPGFPTGLVFTHQIEPTIPSLYVHATTSA